MTASGSPAPWTAPAMKGLSSTMLAKTTSLAQPMQSRSAVFSAAALMVSAMTSTASMLMPARVVATLTEAHTRSVVASAAGIEAIRRRSPSPMPLWTSAEKPPMKSTPTSRAARSSASASGVTSSALHDAASCGDGRDRDAPVDDGDAVLGFERASDRHELLGGCGDAVVDAPRRDGDVRVGAAPQRQAERDGADVEALLLDHQQRLDDLLRVDVHGRPFLGGVCRACAASGSWRGAQRD